jgi:hypothetical protein
MEAPRQNLFDAMHLCGDVSGGHARNLSDGHSVDPFEIQQNDLPVRRSGASVMSR